MSAMEFNLNPGGIICGLAAAGVATGIAYTSGVERDDFLGGVAVISALLGAAMGNIAWAAVFRRHR